MTPTWKKIYHPDGSTEIWPDGKKPEAYCCKVTHVNSMPWQGSFEATLKAALSEAHRERAAALLIDKQPTALFGGKLHE